MTRGEYTTAHREDRAEMVHQEDQVEMAHLEGPADGHKDHLKTQIQVADHLTEGLLVRRLELRGAEMEDLRMGHRRSRRSHDLKNRNGRKQIKLRSSQCHKWRDFGRGNSLSGARSPEPAEIHSEASLG